MFELEMSSCASPLASALFQKCSISMCHEKGYISIKKNLFWLICKMILRRTIKFTKLSGFVKGD
jgi:hypothetical protein